MTAKNMKELEAMLVKQAKKAMQVTQKKAEEDMFEAVGGFYAGGEPVEYERTGALANTPSTSPISSGGNSVSFKAYLNENHQYTTGKNPNMKDILNLTNYGMTNSSVGKLRHAVGKERYWEKAKQNIEKDFKETMGKFFK